MIRLSKSCLSAMEKQAVMRVLDDEYLGMGEDVQNFEKCLTDFFGRPAVCVSSGTAALHLALQAIDVGVGDEVLVQSLTYVAGFQAISATGAKPIACDVDPKTLCLDWKDAKSKITSKTKAIMPVHYGGNVGSLVEIYKLSEEYNLRIIEDAAHAFGTEYQGSKVGGFGDIACFSFDGIKNITSGEGGCVVASDPKVLQRVRDSRLLGVEKDTEKRYSGKRSWEFDVTTQGWRYHMSNIMAAIGIEQLKRFSELSKKRRSFAALYDELLSKVNNIEIFSIDYDYIVPHIYVVQLDKNVDREEIRDALEKKGIQTGVHYYPNHLLSRYKISGLNLINTDEIYSQLLTLPLHPDLNFEDVLYVCDSLKEYINDVK